MAHVRQHKAGCVFCQITDFCLIGLQLDEISDSNDFTVKSIAWTADIIVENTDQSLVLSNTTSQGETTDARYVRVAFRVCETPNDRDRYYFKQRDAGGGSTVITMHEKPCYKQDSRFSIQPWIEATQLNYENDKIHLSGRPFANQIRFDRLRYWVSCLDIEEERSVAPLSISLIDTVEGRLVNGDTSFRYVALSYV